MIRTVKDLKKELEGVDENLEIVTEPSDHTYWKDIDCGEMLVEIGESGEYCDTLEEKEKPNIKKVFFIGVG